MRLKRYIIILLLIALSVSCVKEEGLEPGNNDIVLKAKVERVQLSTKGDGALSPEYSKKMYLGFVRLDEEDGAYPVNGFKDGTAMGPLTATMEGEDIVKPIVFNEVYQTFYNDKDQVKYASWYPWYRSASEETDGKWKYDKANATVTYPEIDGTTDILYGTVVEGRRSKDFPTIEFNHALCKFRIQAYAMEAYDAGGNRLTSTIENWGAIKDITVTGLPSMCYIALPTSGTSSEYTISYSSGEDGVKNYVLSNILGLEEGENILDELSEGWNSKQILGQFMAPPPTDGVLHIDISTSKSSATQGITIARDFKAGHHYDVVLRFSDHGLINCSVEVGGWNVDETTIKEIATGEIFYDLGADETANCYMVSSSNYNYSFLANVKGNGDLGAYNGQNINLAPNYADVVWMDESLKDYFELRSHNLSEGRVIFSVKNPDQVNNGKVTGHKLKAKGNVLIGVYSDESKSQLLWTWHIWVTDKPKDQSYNNGFIVQDRNLGAIAMQTASGEDSDGLYYQWGRPTPFPMRNSLSPSFILSSLLDITINPGGETVETAIGNPTSFYADGAFDETGARKRLWGWTSESDEYSKTIYDPCPPGYRVSSNKIWTEIDFSKTRDNLQGSIHSHEFQMTPKSGTVTYYPMAGLYRVDDNVLKPFYYWSGEIASSVPDQAGAFLWSSTYNESEDCAYYLEMLQNKDAEGNLSLDVSASNNVSLRGSALSVRCVKLNSRAHVTNLSEAQTANSYIISSPGYYKFNATVKGNGVGQLVGYDGSSSLDIREGSPVSIKSELDHVDFLWWQGDLADGNKRDPVKKISLVNGGKPDADGFVKFNVAELPKGNLILAAYDGRGEILWSWHLWFTDSPKLMKCHDYVIMDRFLGATYAPSKDHTSALTEVSSISDANLAASFGLYYQWGRKDPFPGPSISSLTDNATTTCNSWWKYENGSWSDDAKTALDAVANGDDQTIASITASPTTFSSCNETYPNITGYQLSSDDFSESKNIASRAVSISNTTVSEALWGYYSAANFGVTTSKTMYDPCPPGYVVSYYLLWRTADKYVGSNYYSSHDHSWIGVSSDHTEGFESKGFLFDPSRFPSAGFDSIWYPFTGYLDPQGTVPTYKRVLLQGQFYSSTPAGKGARSFIYTVSGTGNIMVEYPNYTGVPTSFGFPVRCQKQ